MALEQVMARSVSATEARVHFGEILRQVVENREVITVERGGKPQAVILSAADYARLTGDDTANSDWWQRLHAFHDRLRAELGDRPLPPPEDVIRELREERDAQIDAAVGNLR